jgi:hypothetical protein
MRLTLHGLSGEPFQWRPITVPSRHSGREMNIQIRSTITIDPKGTCGSQGSTPAQCCSKNRRHRTLTERDKTDRGRWTGRHLPKGHLRERIHLWQIICGQKYILRVCGVPLVDEVGQRGLTPVAREGPTPLPHLHPNPPHLPPPPPPPSTPHSTPPPPAPPHPPPPPPHTHFNPTPPRGASPLPATGRGWRWC